MAKVYGIDLGTTYSAIATLDGNGMPEVIENYADSIPLLASVVYFRSDGEPVIGKEAKNQAEIEPERVVKYIKREIGKKEARVREFDGKSYDAIDISALILKRMKEYADEQGHNVQDVVITCPAYFGQAEHAATKQAGVAAGLNVLNIVNEPTAAALNYCCREFSENRKIMVYDLGGGTFDITLFDFSVDDKGKVSIDVIESGGNDRLGGIDWDARLFDHVCDLYSEENGVKKDEMEAELRLKIQAEVEDVKKAISNPMMKSKKVTISYDGDSTRVEVTRDKFEEITQDLVQQSMDFVRQLLVQTKTAAEDVDVVLLVGGSTRMPMIQNAVEAMFPGKVRVEQPDLAVAKGAALAAAIEWNSRVRERINTEVETPNPLKSSGMEVLAPLTEAEAEELIVEGVDKFGGFSDKLTRSLGPAIYVSEDKYMIDNLLFVGDEIPAEATAQYGTRMENMDEVRVSIYENVSRDRVDKYVTPTYDQFGNEQYTDPELMVKKIGEIPLTLPPNTAKGSPIGVIFRSSTVGLEVRVTNLTTGEEANVVITPENAKTEEELKEAVERISEIRTTGQI